MLSVQQRLFNVVCVQMIWGIYSNHIDRCIIQHFLIAGRIVREVKLFCTLFTYFLIGITNFHQLVFMACQGGRHGAATFSKP
ncbi:hypothetical protein D3C87_1763380 [compost metagenome]